MLNHARHRRSSHRARRPSWSRGNPAFEDISRAILVTMADEDRRDIGGDVHGENEMTACLAQLNAEGDKVASQRGQTAVKSAYLTDVEGVQRHGEGRSWETTGSSRGPIVDRLAQSNHSRPGEEWCGMLIGDAYKKAGIRSEVLRRLVFWSGHPLHLFFTQGKYLERTFGRWWKPYRTLQLGSISGQRRKAALDGFQPQPGDVALFRSDYSHAGMITSTDTLEIIEGNRGSWVSAYETGDNEHTLIGRFNSSDCAPDSSVDRNVLQATTPDVRHDDTVKGFTR